MDIVVDQAVAVLQVLTFGYAVGGEHDVDLALFARFFGKLLRHGAEMREDVLEIGLLEFERVGSVRASRHFGTFQTEFVLKARRELVEQVVGGVGKCGKHEYLVVALVVGVPDLVHNEFVELIELRVAYRRHRVSIREKLVQHRNVEVQILPETQRVDVAQTHPNLASCFEFLRVVIIHAVLEPVDGIRGIRGLGV